jgi:hypothetical protein
VSILQRLFIVLMFVAGFLVARRRPAEMFYLYLLAIVALTNVMADQYLAIPLIACAYYWRVVWGWIYIVPASGLLYWAAAVDAGALPVPAARWQPYLTHLSYQHAQIWIAALLLSALIASERRGRRRIDAREDQVGLKL